MPVTPTGEKAMKVTVNKFLAQTNGLRVRRLLIFGVASATATYSLIHFGFEFIYVLLTATVAGVVALAIHRRTLDQQTRLITEASRMHLATVEALATAIDARDQVGMGHVRRTQIYAVGLGDVLGLDGNDINALRTGALLHDIGKLAVPDHILNKPGNLTAPEMEKTKIHSSVGASILEKVGFPYPVVPTVRHHHEFWDGNGYPEGLKGTNIPLTARILSIADAYDALREARPYRPARTKEDAIRFLSSRAGTQYDPKLVDVFLRNLTRFEHEIATNGLQYQEHATGTGLQQLVVDDSQSPNYVEQIKQANREVFTLYSLAREFSSSLDLNETLKLFADKIAEFVPYDSIAISLLEENGTFASTVYSGGSHNAIFATRRIEVGQGATGYVLKKQKPVINVDPALDLSFSDNSAAADYRVMAALPLFADDRLIGAVSLYSAQVTNFQDEQIRLLETISHIAADAINAAVHHAEAEAYAVTDPMTGLPNSRSLRGHFEKELMRSNRRGTRFQMVVMDLDGFKSVNDTWGHKVGDSMLKAIGNVIKSQLREYDFLARYGGDEFVAIIPETEDEPTESLHDRIATAVEGFALQIKGGATASVGISLGSASYPNDGETLDVLIEAADKAMYLDKESNRFRDVRKASAVSKQPGSELIFDENGYQIVPVLEIEDVQTLASSAAS